MLGSRVFVFHVESMRIVLGATAPGFSWETALVAAVREYYAGATQGRWVQVLASERTERNRRFERWSVLTSRDDVLHVVVREVTSAAPDLEVLPAEIEDDPPELKLALEYRQSAMALVEQAQTATKLRKVASA